MLDTGHAGHRRRRLGEHGRPGRLVDVRPVRGQLRVRHRVRLGRDAARVRPAVVVAAERVRGPGRGVLVRVRHHRLLDDLVRGFRRSPVAAAEQLLERHQQRQRQRDLTDQQGLAGQQRQSLVRHGQQTALQHHQVHVAALVLLLLATCGDG